MGSGVDSDTNLDDTWMDLTLDRSNRSFEIEPLDGSFLLIEMVLTGTVAGRLDAGFDSTCRD